MEIKSWTLQNSPVIILFLCTPKLKASSTYIHPVCCTASLLSESLQFTVYFLFSLNLRKESHSSLLGTIFKVHFSICIFDLFSVFHSMGKRFLVGSQFPHRLCWFEQLLHIYILGPIFIALLEESSNILVPKTTSLKDQQTTKPNSAFCPNSQPLEDKYSFARSRIFTSAPNSHFALYPGLLTTPIVIKSLVTCEGRHWLRALLCSLTDLGLRPDCHSLVMWTSVYYLTSITQFLHL